MSQENPPNCPLRPKKFLKKGEGLKRFAAYKPPLPVSANKLKRRQTFVKFTLDEKPFRRDQTPTYLPPEILYNDSINLSTEIPKIAPPKIMHTPIRPNRQALGTLGASTFNCNPSDDSSSDSEQPYNPYRPRTFNNQTPIRPTMGQHGNKVSPPDTNKILESLPDRNLTRKVVTIQANPLNKMISFNGFRKPSTPSPITAHSPVAEHREEKSQTRSQNQDQVPPKRYNLRGSRKPNSESVPTDVKSTKTRPESKTEPKRTRRQLKAVVERHISPTPDEISDKEEANCITDSQINGNIDELMKKIEERKKASSREHHETEDSVGLVDEHGDKASEHEDCESLRETPVTSGTFSRKCSQAFDLSSPAPGSCILALGQQIQHIESTVNILKDSIKNCECGAYLSSTKTATTTKPLRKSSRTKTSEKIRPSANADNSTYKILSSLMNDVAQLKAKFDEIDLRR